MRVKILAAILLLGCLAAFFLWPQEKIAPPTPPQAAPDFTWNDMNGKSHRLSELDGKVVVLHFWASWCGPCLTEFPEMTAAAQHWPAGIVLLTLSGDNDRAAAQHFIDRYKIQGVLYGYDPAQKISYDIFQTAMFPETIILDRRHNMRQKLPGITDWNSPDVKKILLKLAAEPSLLQ